MSVHTVQSYPLAIPFVHTGQKQHRGCCGLLSSKSRSQLQSPKLSGSVKIWFVSFIFQSLPKKKKCFTICPAAVSGISDLEHLCGAKTLWLWDVRTDLFSFQLWSLRWCFLRNRVENRLLFQVKCDLELGVSQGFLGSGMPWLRMLLASAVILMIASSPKRMGQPETQGGDLKNEAREKWLSPEDSALRGRLGVYKGQGEPVEACSPSIFYSVGIPLRKDDTDGGALTTQHNSQHLGLPSLYNHE